MAGKEFSYEIVKQVAVLSKSPKGWTKEVNVISWNGGTPKYDIRDWTPDHSKMGKGVTLSVERSSPSPESPSGRKPSLKGKVTR